MRNFKYLLSTFLCAVVMSSSLVYGLDKEFIISYANQYGYNPDMVHLANSEEDCDEDTLFDEKYGVCYPLVLTPTDTDVGL